MLKALERNIGSIEERIVFLAPTLASETEAFPNVDVDALRHTQLLREMQRLRGSVYLRDGALRTEQLTRDGLHQTPEDDKGWHMLLLDKQQQVSACLLYREHDTPVPFDHLRSSTISACREQGMAPKVPEGDSV